MKIASLLLACALPFSANAADVCLKVNDQMFLKFKKPALTKGTLAQTSGTLVVSAAGDRPVMYGSAYVVTVIHSDGKIDYGIRAGTDNGLDDGSFGYGEVVFALRNTDKKTFFSGTMSYLMGDRYAYLYDATLDEYVIDTTTPQLSLIKCKEIPTF